MKKVLQIAVIKVIMPLQNIAQNAEAEEYACNVMEEEGNHVIITIQMEMVIVLLAMILAGESVAIVMEKVLVVNVEVLADKPEFPLHNSIASY